VDGGVEMVRKIIRDRERNGQMKMEEIDEHKERERENWTDGKWKR
jgi:hypothetical protein